ncbi:MAG: GNAT family N-acetyltransferase [Dehalococcoidia bacterium]|nr:GNAT family N-acetyltransferase [Dehalococcoidia bacterium]
MSTEYRALTADDYEQAAYLEATAFYGRSTPERVEMLRQFFPPEWTVGAFADGKLVADVRAIPSARRINGGAIGFAAVGPVACLPAYRRQGHVGRLLRLALERMREHGQPLSGLYTPHDALYARYGWERAEDRRHFQFRPKDVRLRLRAEPGSLEQAGPDDWQRLDAVYRAYAGPRNGPLLRVEPWWREAVLRHWEDSGQRLPNEAFVWVDGAGRDQGYIVYHAAAMPRDGRFVPWEIQVRDFVSLTGGAYLGLWEHLLTHDLATRISVELARDDPFPNMVDDPWRIGETRAEGAMLRVVDMERALALRPYSGDGRPVFTMRIADASAPWNEGAWRVEAIEGRMTASRAEGGADVELTANTLAPIFTGYLRPEIAAGAGLLKVNRAEALAEMADAFAVSHGPFCNDTY